MKTVNEKEPRLSARRHGKKALAVILAATMLIAILAVGFASPPGKYDWTATPVWGIDDFAGLGFNSDGEFLVGASFQYPSKVWEIATTTSLAPATTSSLVVTFNGDGWQTLIVQTGEAGTNWYNDGGFNAEEGTKYKVKINMAASASPTSLRVKGNADDSIVETWTVGSAAADYEYEWVQGSGNLMIDTDEPGFDGTLEINSIAIYAYEFIPYDIVDEVVIGISGIELNGIEFENLPGYDGSNENDGYVNLIDWSKPVYTAGDVPVATITSLITAADTIFNVYFDEGEPVYDVDVGIISDIPNFVAEDVEVVGYDEDMFDGEQYVVELTIVVTFAELELMFENFIDEATIEAVGLSIVAGKLVGFPVTNDKDNQMTIAELLALLGIDLPDGWEFKVINLFDDEEIDEDDYADTPVGTGLQIAIFDDEDNYVDGVVIIVKYDLTGSGYTEFDDIFRAAKMYLTAPDKWDDELGWYDWYVFEAVDNEVIFNTLFQIAKIYSYEPPTGPQ